MEGPSEEPLPPRVPPTASSRKRKVIAVKKNTKANPKTKSKSRTDTSNPMPEPIEVTGPQIPELIPNFNKHIAHQILAGGSRERGKEFRIRNHTTTLDTWDPAPFIVAAVERAGLIGIVRASYKFVDGHLLRAFLERWQPNTNTFHLPIGEMTITLEDVRMLVGLPVVGRSVSKTPLRQRKDEPASQLVHGMLGTILPESDPNWGNARAVKLEWLKKKFSKVTGRDTAEKKKYATRAYFLFLFGCTIFSNKSGTLVNVDWLNLIEDLDTLGEYAWGPACLCRLYKELSAGSLAKTKQLSGYVTLFQAWIYEHFMFTMPPKKKQFAGPLACRWEYPSSSTTTDDRCRDLRIRLDELTPDNVIWDPYVTIRDRSTIPDSVFFSGMLRCFDDIEPYHPDRVLRQFGRVQHIPGRPYMSEAMFSKMKPFEAATSVFVACFDREWDRLEEFCLDDVSKSFPVVDGGPDTTPDYMDWFLARAVTRLNTLPVDLPQPARSHPARPVEFARILEMVKDCFAEIRTLDVSTGYTAMWDTLKDIERIVDPSCATTSAAPDASSPPPPPAAPDASPPPPPPAALEEVDVPPPVTKVFTRKKNTKK